MNKETVYTLIGGIFSLVIAMGIGRFAYTVILPYMQEAFQFTDATAGFLATSNYLGYFIGALIAGKMSIQGRKVHYLRLGLIISILTTAVIGLIPAYSVWYVARLVSGVMSGFVFVVVSSIVLDRLANEGKSNLSGVFYAGVGLGIMLSSAIVSRLHAVFSWNGTWIGLAFVCTVLFIFIWLFIQHEGTTKRKKATPSTTLRIQTPPERWIVWLILAYGLEGLGYIVTGTFIVSIAENSPFFNGDATTVWLLVGLAAAPSCIIWSKLALRIGFVKSLIIAMGLQAVGIVLPVIEENSFFLYTSALLFGATFMGIATIATTLARQIAPVNSNRVLGILTASYAFGQMIGPSLAGILATYTNSYNYPLIGAAVVVLIGAACLISGLKFETQYEERRDPHAIRQH